MKIKEINVGLIGYGFGGRIFHAPFINSVNGFKLYKVCETKAQSIQHLKENYKDVQVVSKVEDLIEDPSVQLVTIATPNTFHYDLAKRALENGKDVVVEKPFTVTREEADKLIAIAKSTGRLLTVHQNRRWDSDFRTVRKIVESGLLGEIVSYESNYDRFNPGSNNNWREKNIKGSGMLFDLGSHLIDQVQCLFGLPQEIFAHLEIQKPGGESDDYFKVMMKYPKVSVTLSCGSLVRVPGPRFAIHGTKGSFVKHGFDVQEEALLAGLTPKNVQAWGKEPEELWGKLNTESNGVHIIGKVESEAGDYREFYKNVYGVIMGSESLKVLPEEARNTIRIIELAQKSNKEKRWVKFE